MVWKQWSYSNSKRGGNQWDLLQEHLVRQKLAIEKEALALTWALENLLNMF